MPDTHNEESKIGGELHRILNETLGRKLTTKEYTRAVQLISNLLTTHSLALRKEWADKIEGLTTLYGAGRYLIDREDVLELLK